MRGFFFEVGSTLPLNSYKQFLDLYEASLAVKGNHEDVAVSEILGTHR